jgi:microcin C transport system substrate-binding protein
LLHSLQASGVKFDPEVFGPPPVQPSTTPPSSLRANLLQARSLLEQAGWTYRDGALRNAAGEQFHFEIMDDAGPMGRIIAAYVRNLQKLGIAVDQRTVDYALQAKRMDSFDFDMTSLRLPDIASPGNEMFDMFGSKAADQQGSNNVWGLQDPAVDRIVEALVAADTRPALDAAARALDRVLLHKAITVPQWYSSTHRIAYARRFGMPAKLPLYYQADSYVISTWWQTRPR